MVGHLKLWPHILITLNYSKEVLLIRKWIFSHETIDLLRWLPAQEYTCSIIIVEQDAATDLLLDENMYMENL